MRQLVSFLKKMWHALWHYIEDRTGVWAALKPLLKHDVPPNIGWPYVLGSATLLVFIMQVVTGFALASAYIASPADAYESLEYITYEARFGNLLRGMHFYGASAMVILITLHALRTFLYGSYKFPREVNWLTGVFLLAFTLAMAWTGQLLRWDENGVWTVVVGAYNVSRIPLAGPDLAEFILAGETVGGPTLSRFFTLHIMLLPALILLFIVLHLYLVIRNGISEPPEPGRPVDPATYRSWYHAMLENQGKPFWPHAAWRDAVFGTAVAVVIVLLALLFGAQELAGSPDPSRVVVEPHPDWFFRWYDALVTIALPQFETLVMLVLPCTAALLLLALPFVANRGERSVTKRPWAIMTVLFVVAIFGWLTFASRHGRLIPNFDVESLPVEVVGATDGPIADGAQLFQANACINCHTIAGYGGQVGPDLTYIGDWRTAHQIRTIIITGTPAMPSYLDALSVEELEQLVTFLESRRRESTP